MKKIIFIIISMALLVSCADTYTVDYMTCDHESGRITEKSTVAPYIDTDSIVPRLIFRTCGGDISVPNVCRFTIINEVDSKDEPKSKINTRETGERMFNGEKIYDSY